MTADPATTTNDPDLELGDEDYDSAEDEDFELDAAQDEGSEVSSESEAEGEQPAKKKRKTVPKGKKVRSGDQEEELDSGDEVTIQKAKDRKKKKQTKGQQAKGKAGDEEDEEDDVDFDEDEEGGTGGFVRTRAMKMRTYVYCFIPVHVLLIDLLTYRPIQTRRAETFSKNRWRHGRCERIMGENERPRLGGPTTPYTYRKTRRSSSARRYQRHWDQRTSRNERTPATSQVSGRNGQNQTHVQIRRRYDHRGETRPQRLRRGEDIPCQRQRRG